MRGSVLLRRIRDWSTVHKLFHDYHVESPLPAEDSMLPNNKQARHSGSCFVIAPITIRQQLQKLFPDSFLSGEATELDVVRELDWYNRLRYHFGRGLGGGFPAGIFEKLVGSFDSDSISEWKQEALKARVRCTPCLLPYLPALPADRTTATKVHVVSKDEYVDAFVANIVKTEHHTRMFGSGWHSQATVGLATHIETGQQYFVCRQSWEGFDVTLIPFITQEDMRTSISAKSRSLTAQQHSDLMRSHVIYVPTPFQPTGMQGLKMNHQHAYSTTSGGAFYKQVSHAMFKTYK